MRHVLDASELIPLIVGRGKRLVAEASNQGIFTTDLAIYETCNALWKLPALLKSISFEDAEDIAKLLRDLAASDILELLDYRGLDVARTLNTANTEHITFYDASYIVIADAVGATLVTEDKKLRQAANKYVRTTTYADFEKMLSESHA